MRALLIDGGQSGCRAALLEDGEIVARASGPGLPRVGRSYAALRSLIDEEVDVVAAGLTGYRGGRVFDGPAIVTNDAVIAYLGALGDEPGAVICAGTGVIALASDGDAIGRHDGHGPLLGDRGGGYWIGQHGLQGSLAYKANALTEAATARYGPDIIGAVYDSPDPVATIAAFAPDVVALADAGDGDSKTIVRYAAGMLARSAFGALRDTRAPRVCSWSGGVFAAGEALLAPLRKALREKKIELRPPLGGPLDGAARLLERPARFASLIEEVP
jgi:glucosamine kinase